MTTTIVVDVSADEIRAALESNHGETSMSMFDADAENATQLICSTRPWSSGMCRRKKAIDPLEYAVRLAIFDLTDSHAPFAESEFRTAMGAIEELVQLDDAQRYLDPPESMDSPLYLFVRNTAKGFSRIGVMREERIRVMNLLLQHTYRQSTLEHVERLIESVVCELHTIEELIGRSTRPVSVIEQILQRSGSPRDVAPFFQDFLLLVQEKTALLEAQPPVLK